MRAFAPTTVPQAAASDWAFSLQTPVTTWSAEPPAGRKFAGTSANCIDAPPCWKRTS